MANESLIASSLEDDEELSAEEEGLVLDGPLNADQTHRLAESWKKRYSADAAASGQEDGEQDVDLENQVKCELVIDATFHVASAPHEINRLLVSFFR